MRITTGLIVTGLLGMLSSQAGQSNAFHVNLAEKMANQPLGFEPNRGQARADVDFVAATGSGNVYVKPTGALVLVSQPDSRVGTTLEIDFAGSRPHAKAEAENLIPRLTSSYFIGNDPAKWITGLRKYAKIKYHDVWPGIDVVYYGNGTRLEYDFIVAPGSSPSAIQLKFSGMDSVRLTEAGDLELKTAAGLVRQSVPVIYQTINGTKRKLAGHYVLSGNEARFQVARYDASKPLIIDPTLVYARNNSLTLQGNGVAVDSNARVYLTGQSSLTTSGTKMVYVWLLDNGGNDLTATLTYGTATGDTQGNALVVDSSLNLYIAGTTSASDLIRAGGFQPGFGGSTDGFFTKLALQNGSYSPVYSTYIGGAGNDSANAVAVDSTGKVYVAGTTSSSNFPTTTGTAYRATGSTAFLVKIDPSIQVGPGSLLYSTLIGGTGTDAGTSVAVDASSNAYVAGSTSSPTTPLPGFQPASSVGFAPSKGNANQDGFIVKLNAAGTAATNLTFISNGPVNGIALGSDNSVYATGSTPGGIPINSVVAGYQTSPQGSSDAFLIKFDPTLSTLGYSSYLGGTQNDVGYAVAVDQNGNAAVVGQTFSPNFPSTTTALLGSGSDILPDAFVARINTSTSGSVALTFSGMLGGDGPDLARSVVLDSQGFIYVTGDTSSTNFPPATGQTSSQRAFAAKINIPAPPQVVSVTPSSGSGSSQIFQFLASESSGATDLQTVWMWFAPSFNSSTANSCLLYYNQSVNQINLLNDAGSAWMPMTPGGGTLQNSQCSLSAGSMTVTPSGNNLTVSLPMTFKAPYAGNQQVWMYASTASANSGWQQRGSWTVTGVSTTAVVSAVSVTPNSGSGSAQAFQFLASDSLGATDLQTVWMWFAPNFSSSTSNSCLLYYNRASNVINLLNDSGSSWMSMTAGTSGSLQNSQCSVDGSGVAITPSGNNLTVSLPITFKASYAGNQQIWMYAAAASANSGWQQRGSWTATAPAAAVSAVSVTPNSGSGSSQTFQFLASDANGATDLQTVWMWFTPSFNSSTANSCLLYYNQSVNQINLLNDAGNSWMSMTPGGGTLQNSQCSLSAGSMTVTPSGNNLAVSLPMTFKAPYAGNQQVWMYAGAASANSGWQQRGSWTVTGVSTAAVVSAVSVTPNSGSGSTQAFQFLASDSLGATDLQTVWMWFTPSFSSPTANSCLIYYSRSTNVLNLLNDAGNSWMSMGIGSGTLQNSQCSVNAGTTTVTPSGNNLTLSIPVSFKAAYAGNQQVWMYGAGAAGNSGWQQRGTWTATAPSAPVSAVSVTPNSGSGLTQTFQFLASDSNGSTDLQTVWMWFTPGFSSPTANSCLIYYNQASNQINLLNDAGSTWMSMTAGAVGTLQNSQCSLNVGAMTTAPSGTNLTVSLPMTFKAAYTGAKQIWMYAAGGAGNSGWQQKGGWTAQ